MLFVPGGCRQHDVGVDARRGHPEIDVDEQVELALGRLVAPGDLRRPGAGGGSSAPTALSVPSKWRKKYSWPLPEEPSRLERHTVSTRGKFAGSSGSLARKMQPSLLQLLDYELIDCLSPPCPPGRRSPAGCNRTPGGRGASRGARRSTLRSAALLPGEAALAERASPWRRRWSPLVTPLVGGKVPERGPCHVAGGAIPSRAAKARVDQPVKGRTFSWPT